MTTKANRASTQLRQALFSDIELQNVSTLAVSAISDRHMAVLLALLHEQAGVSRGVPPFAHTTVQPVAKPTG